MVALVLHAGVERDHREVVGVRDGVYVAGEAERERGERNDLREAAARRAALDVEGGAAGRLADASDHLLAEPPKSLDEPKRRRGLAFAERRRSDGGDVYVLALPPRADSLQHLGDVDLREDTPVRRPLVVLKP